MSDSGKRHALDLSQVTALVTGATSGVGKIVAERLAASGARVLVHGRSAAESHFAYYRADLASLDEVRRLAGEVAAQHDRLHVLVNNAGIGFGPPGGAREKSRDGHELRFAVNYLAPFLLTHLLLPLLQRGAPARIVNVASLGQASLDFDDVMLERGYDGRRAYGQSKLALIMFTFDLAEALRGTGVTANAIHPATLMNTRMVAEAGLAPQSRVEDGAGAILRLATAPELARTSGELFDGLHRARAMRQAYDERARRTLAELSRKWTKLA
jgi:NAD(P)-dependent dehydrogenase (short-subunit alcohol dehydrogenase family)